jgi:hypothetical protein
MDRAAAERPDGTRTSPDVCNKGSFADSKPDHDPYLHAYRYPHRYPTADGHAYPSADRHPYPCAHRYANAPAADTGPNSHQHAHQDVQHQSDEPDPLFHYPGRC